MSKYADAILEVLTAIRDDVVDADELGEEIVERIGRDHGLSSAIDYLTDGIDNAAVAKIQLPPLDAS